MKMPKGSLGLLIGLVLGLALTLGLSFQFTRSATAQETDRHNGRQATITAQAFASLVEASLAAETAPDLQAVTQQYMADSGETVKEIRVLKLSGAKLLASTREGDKVGKRIPRDEKPFFDLAKELKSGMATNKDEGVFRKREIALEPVEEGSKTLVVTAPYFEDTKYKGVVQMRFEPMALTTPTQWQTPWLLLFAILGLGIIGILALKGDESRVKMLGWALALPLAIGLYLSNGGYVQAFFDARGNIEQSLYDMLVQQRTAVDKVATALEVPYTLPSDVAWDEDEYHRPYGFLSLLGKDDVAISEDLTAFVAPLRKSLTGNVVVGLLLYLFFGLGFALSIWRTLVEHRGAYAYVTPAMLGMLILVFFPFFYGMALSFTGQTLYNTDKPLTEIFVGFDNYIEILADWEVFKKTAEGTVINYQNFYWTAFITICWTVCNVAIGVSVGLALALCLNVTGFGVFKLGRFNLDIKPIYRAILVLPWALPTYVTALIWKGLFHKQFGPINQMIQIFGGEGISWFDSVFTSFLTGIIVNGWLSFPFMMLISLGGLQSISADMYEAARLDGASKFQQFRYITVPSLKPTLIPAIIISVVWTFNLFNVIYLVSGGEPAGANEILVTQAYKIAFEKYQYGYAAAYSAVIFIILLTYGIFQNKMSNATEDIKA